MSNLRKGNRLADNVITVDFLKKIFDKDCNYTPRTAKQIAKAKEAKYNTFYNALPGWAWIHLDRFTKEEIHELRNYKEHYGLRTLHGMDYINNNKIPLLKAPRAILRTPNKHKVLLSYLESIVPHNYTTYHEAWGLEGLLCLEEKFKDQVFYTDNPSIKNLYECLQKDPGRVLEARFKHDLSTSKDYKQLCKKTFFDDPFDQAGAFLVINRFSSKGSLVKKVKYPDEYIQVFGSDPKYEKSDDLINSFAERIKDLQIKSSFSTEYASKDDLVIYAVPCANPHIRYRPDVITKIQNECLILDKKGVKFIVLAPLNKLYCGQNPFSKLDVFTKKILKADNKNWIILRNY